MTTVRRAGAAALLLGSVLATPLVGHARADAQPAKHHSATHKIQTHKIPKHIGPARTAWFDTTRATAAAPGLPEPGVKPSDLVVDGLTVAVGQLPVGVPVKVPDTSQIAALAALTYRIPKGATVSTLSLKLSGLTTAKVDGSLPGGVSPTACPVTASFKKGPQQIGSKAPTYDCKKRTAIGQLSTDKTAIQFPGIGRLVHDRQLSFVILPGTIGLERLVFAKPGKTSLRLLSFDTSTPTGPDPAPTSTSAPSSPPASSGNPPPSSTVPGSSANLPPIDQSVPTTGSGTAPQVATNAAPTPAARISAVKPLDDTRARAAAIALLVGLTAAAAWLASTDRRPRTAGAEWGVGRFKSSRTGPPPTI